ncbi:methylmalonyl-CoA mutase [Pseudomonas sp. CR3202]|uniref:methylmalonyl-CoA mutase n=1 Tax=Pseudomonas sp. CR3202 TaxID=3351532 RepID=UPI003BF3C9CA
MNPPRRPRPRSVPLKPLYRAADLDGLAHLDDLPGEAPFVRGPYPGMYTERPWTLRQYAGFASAAETNRWFRQSLAEGVQGLSVAFDLPTHRGYDSDALEADVGRAGVAIDSVEDMRELFAGIDLAQVSVSMTMNGAVLPVLAAFIVAAEESGVGVHQLSGTIQNDILKEFMVRNTYLFSPAPSLRIATDVFEYLTHHLPRFNALSVSGYHLQEAGADPALELGLTLLNARTYVECAKTRGLDLDTFCRRLSFFFGIGSDFYLEVAKLRAARLLWAEISAELGVTSPRARALRTHCQTSGWSLAAQGAQNNIVRTTVEAMAAVFGGTQSLHTNAWDEALGLPGAEAAQLARNTQLILQDEFGLCDSVDPWAGSYLMESLTAALANAARQLIAQVDAEGGVLAALDSGWIDQHIHAAAVRTQARIDSGATAILGVTRHPQSATDATACQNVDSAQVRQRQLQRLDDLRRQRDPVRVAHCLEALTRSAQFGEGNLLTATLEAIRARATVGECTEALERVWPRHQATPRCCQGAYAELRQDEPVWQALRRAVADLRERRGHSPRLLFGKLGQDGHDRGVRVLASILSDLGFDVHLGPLFQSPDALANLAWEQAVDLVGVSSLAGAHDELLPTLLERLATRGMRVPVVAGGVIPAADCTLLERAGIAACFGPGSDPLVIAERILALISNRHET